MEERNSGWLRVRGIGRERLARYVSEFLTGAGYRVDETNETAGGQPSSRLVADLARPNPAVPSSFVHLEFRTSPTAGGSLLRWEVPRALAQESERARALRFATELSSNVEQKVALESRSAGRVSKEGPVPPPLAPATTASAAPASAATEAPSSGNRPSGGALGAPQPSGAAANSSPAG